MEETKVVFCNKSGETKVVFCYKSVVNKSCILL